jgi:hypothetical protein
MFDRRGAEARHAMTLRDRMIQMGALRHPTALLGALLAAATFPQVWMALEAGRELAGRVPNGIHFIDYQTHAWSRYAFVLSHLWLGLQVRASGLGASARFKTGLVILLSLELALVWTVVVLLALRGWGSVLF